MQPTQPKTASEARQQAIDWQVWQADKSLSYGELLEWALHFQDVVDQYPKLRDEFIENCII